MKNKYLTFSFDDCEIYDRKLCELFRKYKMKATFFLISDQLGFRCDFHRYGENTVVERVSAKEVLTTYAGMEVATHTRNHKCPVNDLEDAVWDSAEYLSSLCGYKVRGMAYPGGVYTSEHIQELKRMGMCYARTTQSTHCFEVPKEWLAWNPTCRYDDDRIGELVNDFLAYSSDKPAVFHIYGHSYELTRKEDRYNFEGFERLLQKLSGRDDIVYATNLEVWEAFKCME